MKPNLSAGLFAGLLLSAAPAQAIVKTSPTGAWTYNDDITIQVSTNPEDPAETRTMALPANIFVPQGIASGETRPAIVFVNSWTLNEYEYADQAEAFADDGYIVLSYTTRGFRGAPGLIDTAGNKDISDASAAIDWLVTHYPVDADHVGMSGVSYGAGISLLTAVRTQKVAAVVAMSGWGNLVDALWAGQTPEQTWVGVLIGSSSWPLGRRDPEIDANLDNMRRHRNVQSTIAWGMERSALNYVEQANAGAKKPALYVSNNLHDYLFQPTTMIGFVSRYAGPWRLDFNRGSHATSESSALLQKNADNYQWKNAHYWFDHYLKGVDNGIDAIKPVNSVVLASEGEARESYDGFPVHEAVQRFYVTPEATGTDGTLADVPGDAAVETTLDATHDTVWTGGILGSVDMEARTYKLADIDRQGAMVFQSPVLGQTLYLRGSPVLTFSARVKHNAQFFGYLLDLDPDTGEAHWVGHGPLTWHRAEGATEDPVDPVSLSLEMFWTTHDIVAGHRLVLVVDIRDPDYWRFTDSPTKTTFVTDAAHPMTLDVPVIRARKAFTEVKTRSPESGSVAAPAAPTTVYQPTGGAIGAWSALLLAGLMWYRRRSAANAVIR